MSQPPPTPRQRKVQEALDLFAQLQGVPFAITDDEQRVKHAANLERQQQASSAASSSVNNSAGKVNLNGANGMLKKGSGSGGGAAPSATTTKQLQQQIVDLQRKLALSDAIMKKLHRKNKELSTEAEKFNTGNGGVASVGSDANAASVGIGSGYNKVELSTENLKSIIARRDQEIISLKKQLALAQQHPQEASSNSPQVASTPASSTAITPRTQLHNNAKLSSTATPSGAPYSSSPQPTSNTSSYQMPSTIPAEAQVGLLHKRIESLQKDYQALVDSKLDAIATGESTGKVNKQVKVFFAAVKAKMATDVADYEAERVLWNQRVAAALKV